MKKERICINCKEVVETEFLKKDQGCDDLSITPMCPICYEDQTLVDLERLSNVDGFKRFLDSLEVRN